MPAQAIINNLDFALKAQEFHDRIANSQFSRLGDMLADGAGELECSLLGKGTNQQGLPYLQLRIQGGLHLTCQRCLEPMTYDLDIVSNFVVVAAGHEALADSDDTDDLDDHDYLVADAEMRIMDLIEDELLLSLPVAPMHESATCAKVAELNADESRKASPFAALQGLKTGKRQN